MIESISNNSISAIYDNSNTLKSLKDDTKHKSIKSFHDIFPKQDLNSSGF